MATDNNPPGATVELCPHGIPENVDCTRCDNAAEVGRPVGGGPRAAQLYLAKHTGYCSCNNFIIAGQDKVKRIDGEWHRHDCDVEAGT